MNLVFERLAKSCLLAFIFVLGFIAPALAHSGGLGEGLEDTFNAGFLHPILGIDHLLAMVSVGIISAMIGGRAIWTVPLAFLGAMALGAVAAQTFMVVAPQVVEGAIAASVVLLGVAIALERRVSIWMTFGFVAFFGFFHGFAHGAETPVWANPAAFGVGFLFGSALIHLQGVFIGALATRYPVWKPAVRLTGTAFMIVGVLVFAGAM